jgi:CheY-like chemotaxis protein
MLGMKYKLIFTDFNMPIMDGVEACRGLREILEDEPTIVGVTGYASSNYHQIGMDAGMNAVVSKPMYFQTMKAILAKYY